MTTTYYPGTEGTHFAGRPLLAVRNGHRQAITTRKETAAMKILYTVRRPIATDPLLRREGAVVSRHTTFSGASRSLDRQRRGAERQGGFSQDYIWDEAADREVSN